MILVNCQQENPVTQIRKEIKKINHQRKYHSGNGGVDFKVNPKIALVKDIIFLGEFDPMYKENIICYYKHFFGWTKAFAMPLKDMQTKLEKGKDIKSSDVYFKYDDFLDCYDVYTRNFWDEFRKTDLILTRRLEEFLVHDDFMQPVI